MADVPPDRRHNREEDSPEALRQSIEELADSIAQLNHRLKETTLRLEAEVDGARSITRRLATEVGLMGAALVKRIDSKPPQPALNKRRRSLVWALALAVTFGLMLAAAGLVVFSR